MELRRYPERLRLNIALTFSFSQSVVSVGAAFRSGGHSAAIRSYARALSHVGMNALIYDDAQDRILVGLDDVDFARDAETHLSTQGVRLVFLRDIDPEQYLGSDQQAVAVLDFAPDPEDRDTIDILSRFDTVFGMSKWVVEELAKAGIDATWIGRVTEPAERALMPRSHFNLPDSARVVVIPFDADEFIHPCAEGIYEAYVQALLARDTTGDVRVAVIASADAMDLPGFPDDPRVTVHDLVHDDYLMDSLLAAADCVVSFDSFLRVAKSLGRAEWFGVPVLAMGLSADRDLISAPMVTSPIADDVDAAQLAQDIVDRTIANWTPGLVDETVAPAPRGHLLTHSSYRAVAMRLSRGLNKLSS